MRAFIYNICRPDVYNFTLLPYVLLIRRHTCAYSKNRKLTSLQNGAGADLRDSEDAADEEAREGVVVVR